MSNEMTKASSEMEDKKELIKSLYCKGLDKNEMEHFFVVCNKLDLNPLAKQIYVYKMGGKMTIIVSIDGLRLVADRSKRYAPGKETSFSYIESDKSKPFSATSYVKKQTSDGTWHEVSATAMFQEYTTNQNLWKKMPHVMLAKCAEAQALRKAFPAELSGVYTQEEMDQAEVLDAEEIVSEEKPKEPEISLERSCELLNRLIGVENNADLRSYVSDVQARTKISLTEMTNKWIENKEKFITYFNSWQEKQATNE